MKHSKKYLMLGLSLITFSIYCAKKTSSQAQPTAQASTQPKPMTTTPTTAPTVINSATSTVSVMFFNQSNNALTPTPNTLAPNQALNIPLGAVSIYVNSGSKCVISASITSGKSYIIIYTNAVWTLKAV